ncbi:hypothetical protein E4198_13255 [Streptomyces sp. RKND-216]|uniref:hypothetical protein n=1 Tax=Streptomyces sp. RKND-216 TaxID=2562581 RepID=UPI00109DFA61|nr:hypothetical protein [Streptomyces sp. RKND-216]THA25554.1 hypothetical protein E4198_13255 [Streptomyces sp. RKND-216]
MTIPSATRPLGRRTNAFPCTALASVRRPCAYLPGGRSTAFRPEQIEYPGGPARTLAVALLWLRPWRGRTFGVAAGLPLLLCVLLMSWPASRGYDLFDPTLYT